MNAVMSAVFTGLSAAAGDQTPPPDDLVTPGVVGFFAIFFVAVATVLLGFDLVRRIRRTTYREQIRERLEAEAVEQAGTGQPTGAATDAATDASADAAASSPTDQAGSAEK